MTNPQKHHYIDDAFVWEWMLAIDVRRSKWSSGKDFHPAVRKAVCVC